MNGFYDVFWIFILYAFIGWCCEVIFAAVVLGKFVNRGFLNGPFCPIYGFGMLGALFCLTPIKDNLIILFLGSILLTSFLELVVGYVLERMFHTKWWDYSDKPFNLNGYICLAFSLLWGLGCVFVLRLVHPAIQKLIYLVPTPLGYTLLIILYVLFLTDVVLTVISILGLKWQFGRLEKLTASIKKISDELGENLSDGTLAAMGANERFKVLLEDKKDVLEDAINKIPKHVIHSYHRLFKAFPKLKNHKVYQIVERFLPRKKDK